MIRVAAVGVAVAVRVAVAVEVAVGVGVGVVVGVDVGVGVVVVVVTVCACAAETRAIEPITAVMRASGSQSHNRRSTARSHATSLSAPVNYSGNQYTTHEPGHRRARRIYLQSRRGIYQGTPL